MSLLREFLNYRPEEEEDEDEFEGSQEDDLLDDSEEDGQNDEDQLDQQDPNEEDFGDGEMSDEDQGDPNDDQEMDQVASKATENPDRQGLIRAVKGAHLVYKRQIEDGTYEELWVFNSTDSVAKNLDIRKAILSGTDIPTNKTSSPDGKQQYELWTAGNAELLSIVGLPN